MSRSTTWQGRGRPVRRVASEGGETAPPGATPADPGLPDLPGLGPEDIDPEELREFMAADWVEVKADPGFREQLRARLWKMLTQQREGAIDDDGDGT